MKKLLFWTAFVSFAAALSTTSSAAQSKNDETCSKVYSYAQSVMKARQAGVPMPKMIEIAGDDNISRKMVITAYDKPKFSSQSYIDNEVSEFADFWYSDCVKALSK